jgi:hypothetical protein
MKKIFYITLFSFFTFFWASAQEKTISFAKSAFKARNIGLVSSYMHSEVAIVQDDEQIASGKSAAEEAMKGFFAKYVATNFDFLHQGSSKDGKTFAVGKYDYAGGCYRVTIKMKNYGGEYLIDTIDLTKE